MPYRLVYAGLGLLLVATIALGFALLPSGEPTDLPGPIEEVFPKPGDSVIRQTDVEVDLEIGYELELWVDGFRVPDSEVVFVDATGVARWAPSPNGLYLTEWTPGSHTIRVVWNRVSGPTDVGEFQWEFRVQ